MRLSSVPLQRDSGLNSMLPSFSTAATSSSTDCISSSIKPTICMAFWEGKTKKKTYGCYQVKNVNPHLQKENKIKVYFSNKEVIMNFTEIACQTLSFLFFGYLSYYQTSNSANVLWRTHCLEQLLLVVKCSCMKNTVKFIVRGDERQDVKCRKPSRIWHGGAGLGICNSLAPHAGADLKQLREREWSKPWHNDVPDKRQQWRSYTFVHKARGRRHHLGFLKVSSWFLILLYCHRLQNKRYVCSDLEIY